MLDFKNKIKQLKDRNYLINNPTEVLLIKKVFNDVLVWNDFVSLIDFTSTNNYYSSNVRREAIAEYADEFYIRVADIINPNTKKSVGNLFPNLDEVVTFCNELFEEEIDYAECYVNFKRNASVKPAHNDQWIAVAWTCVGKIEWRIYKEPSDKNYDSYITEPGDIIIIPKGVLHSVVPIEPRMSISFGYCSDKNIVQS